METAAQISVGFVLYRLAPQNSSVTTLSLPLRSTPAWTSSALVPLSFFRLNHPEKRHPAAPAWHPLNQGEDLWQRKKYLNVTNLWAHMLHFFRLLLRLKGFINLSNYLDCAARLNYKQACEYKRYSCKHHIYALNRKIRAEGLKRHTDFKIPWRTEKILCKAILPKHRDCLVKENIWCQVKAHAFYLWVWYKNRLHISFTLCSHH